MEKTSDWRNSLRSEGRERIVNKLMETLNMWTPIYMPEGLNELQKTAVQFEQEIYDAALSQADYLRRIDLKKLEIEQQNTPPTNPSIPTMECIPNQNPMDLGTSSYESSVNKRPKIEPTMPVVCSNITIVPREGFSEKLADVVKNNTQPAEVVPKEDPVFTCPVCWNEHGSAWSTICGHIFCEKCIKASIKAQKKCPTCRRKLSLRSNNFHRVYLPSIS